MGLVYLLLLAGGIGCMLLLDRRFRLFFWHDPAVALLVTAIGTAGFLAWDVAGIAAGVFLRGDSAVATGIVLAPELPLEEPVFLVFLVLCTMIVFTGGMRLLAALAARRGSARSADAAPGPALDAADGSTTGRVAPDASAAGAPRDGAPAPDARGGRAPDARDAPAPGADASEAAP